MKTNIRKGFTLIELLVVIAIIGILAAITVVSVQGPRNRAQNTRFLADLRQVSAVMEQYSGDNAEYPHGAAASDPINTWAALQTELQTLADFEAPLPTGYKVYSTSTNYCLYHQSVGDTATWVVCSTGSQCSTDTPLASTTSRCGGIAPTWP